MTGPLTHSPDPQHLGTGAGTAAAQTAVPRQYADPDGTGYVDTDPNAPIVATGATAGTPGTFTPAGCVTPANAAAMAGITASPATLWTVGQHVITGDGIHRHWNGTAWATGDAPV